MNEERREGIGESTKNIMSWAFIATRPIRVRSHIRMRAKGVRTCSRRGATTNPIQMQLLKSSKGYADERCGRAQVGRLRSPFSPDSLTSSEAAGFRCKKTVLIKNNMRKYERPRGVQKISKGRLTTTVEESDAEIGAHPPHNHSRLSRVRIGLERVALWRVALWRVSLLGRIALLGVLGSGHYFCKQTETQ